MSFGQWFWKKWYVSLPSVVLGAMLMQFVGDLFFQPLANASTFVGFIAGVLVSYLIYKAE